jgi:hypothetical protein
LRGRPKDPEILLAAYAWLLERLNGATRSELARRQVLPTGRVVVLSETGVTKAIGRLRSVLPGRWKHFFTSWRDRSGNDARQQLFPLPGSLGLDEDAPIGGCRRDLIALRLYCATSPVASVAAYIGLHESRVHRIVDHYSSRSAAEISALTGLPAELVSRVFRCTAGAKAGRDDHRLA